MQDGEVAQCVSSCFANMMNWVSLPSTHIKGPSWPPLPMWDRYTNLARTFEHQPSSRFTEKAHLRGIRWRIVKQNTQYLLLDYTFASMHIPAYLPCIYTHTGAGEGVRHGLLASDLQNNWTLNKDGHLVHKNVVYAYKSVHSIFSKPLEQMTRETTLFLPSPDSLLTKTVVTTHGIVKRVMWEAVPILWLIVGCFRVCHLSSSMLFHSFFFHCRQLASDWTSCATERARALLTCSALFMMRRLREGCERRMRRKTF